MNKSAHHNFAWYLYITTDLLCSLSSGVVAVFQGTIISKDSQIQNKSIAKSKVEVIQWEDIAWKTEELHK